MKLFSSLSVIIFAPLGIRGAAEAYCHLACGFELKDTSQTFSAVGSFMYLTVATTLVYKSIYYPVHFYSFKFFVLW